MQKLKITVLAFTLGLLGWWAHVVTSAWPALGPLAIFTSPLLMLAELQGVVASARPPSELLPSAGSLCEFDVNLRAGPSNQIVSEIGNTARSFQYRGRQFLRTGDSWQDNLAVAQLTVDGSELAFISYSGPMRPYGLDRFRLHVRWWNTYIDAYEISSGLKLATLSWIRVLDTKPLPVSTRWDGNQILVFREPLGDGKCVVRQQVFPAATP